VQQAIQVASYAIAIARCKMGTPVDLTRSNLFSRLKSLSQAKSVFLDLFDQLYQFPGQHNQKKFLNPLAGSGFMAQISMSFNGLLPLN
jgi:hypothetical protein